MFLHFEVRGVFDFLPLENRDLSTRLKLVTYVMKKSTSARMMKSTVFELAKRFIEKQGWIPSRVVHAYKLTEEN